MHKILTGETLQAAVREILQSEAEKQHFKQVKKITLEIGALSCIEPDALRFAFDAVMSDSLILNSATVPTGSPPRFYDWECKKATASVTSASTATGCWRATLACRKSALSCWP